MGHSKSSSKREFYRCIGPPPKIRKNSSKQPNLTPEGTKNKNNKEKNPKLVEINISMEIN